MQVCRYVSTLIVCVCVAVTRASHPSATAADASGKVGFLTFTTPAGWSELVTPDGVLLRPRDLPVGELIRILIMKPVATTGTLEQALASGYDDAIARFNGSKMFQGDRAYGTNGPRTSFNGWPYIRGKGGIRAANGDELGLEVFAIKLSNRIERVAIVESRENCGDGSRYYAADRLRYRNAIESFLYSIRFDDFDTPPLASGSAKGGGLIGVWQGSILSSGAAIGLRLEAFTPIFLTNGQVYFGPKFPTEGLAGLNTRIPPELYPRDWGTYTLTGNSGTLKMPYGDVPIKVVGDRLLVTRGQRDWPFQKVQPVDGATFEGTYALGSVNGQVRSITFSSDGRFTDRGALKALSSDPGACVSPGATPGAGTYEVRDYSMIFTYSDGRAMTLAFADAGYTKDNRTPARLKLSFNEDALVRQ